MSGEYNVDMSSVVAAQTVTRTAKIVCRTGAELAAVKTSSDNGAIKARTVWIQADTGAT